MGAQTTAPNEWTWMGGSSKIASINNVAVGQPGIYGTLGTSAPGNIPGARESAAAWTDRNGNLWLFGGLGYDTNSNGGYLNDLWEFSPSTNEWTWMGGSSTLPTSCASPALTACGQPGSYGTLGATAAQNGPGSRSGAMYWTDSSGNFWLFGGAGMDGSGKTGLLNDLWKFDASAKMWTWISGSDVLGSNGGRSGVYGTLELPSASNTPGSRQSGMTWLDANGLLWLYGGQGFDALGNDFQLNDLWQFDPSAERWTWMGGSSAVPPSCRSTSYGVCGQVVAYGELGVPAAGVNPGARVASTTWKDHDGNFWLFGGLGVLEDSSTNSIDEYDQYDLWKYMPSIKEWAWMGGNGALVCGLQTVNSLGQGQCEGNGVFGTLGTPAASNTPTNRSNAVGWIDRNGSPWLFGGVWTQTEGVFASLALNDLWTFNPSANEWAWMSGTSVSTFPVTTGTWGVLGAPAAGNTPSGRNGAASWTDRSGNLWLFGGFGWPSNNSLPYDLNDLWVYEPAEPTPAPSYTLVTPPYPVIAAAGTSVTAMVNIVAGDGFDSTVSLSASGLPAGVTASFSPISITGNGKSTMTITVNSGVASYPTYSFAVAGTSGNASETASVTLNVGGPTSTATPTFSPGSGDYPVGQMVAISDRMGGANIYYTTDGTTPTTSSTPYSGPLTVSASEKIQAIAVVPGYPNSAVGGATYTVAPPAFSLSVSPTSLTVRPGSSGTGTLTVMAKNGFNSATSFACSGMPTGTTCTFSPSTVTPSGGNPATTQLTIAAKGQSAALQRDSRPFFRTTALAVVFCVFGYRRRRSIHRLLLVGAISVGLLLIPGCGGGSSRGVGGGGGTATATTTVTITATAGTLQENATLMLTVN